jgi:hypothetical protein
MKCDREKYIKGASQFVIHQILFVLSNQGMKWAYSMYEEVIFSKF